MKKLDLSKALFLCSVVGLIFLYGIAVGHYHLFPFPVLEFMKNSFVEVLAEREMRTGVRPTWHLGKAHFDGDGVTYNDRERAFPGFTLLSGFFKDGLELRLIRPDGSVLARWPAHFHELFPDTSHIQPADDVPRTDWNTSVLGAMAFPDGSIIFNLESGGLAKLDRCGAVQWTVPKMVHHSIEAAEGGGFWVPSMRHIQANSRFAALAPPYKEDTVIRISQTGEVVQEFSTLDVLFDNNLGALLFANGPDGITIGRPDITHLNDVEELKSNIAGRFPLFSAGDLLLSVRNLNLLMVVDPITHKVKWYQTGPWMDQHDPDFEANGKISVFSNNNDVTEKGSILGGTTIIEVDPVTRATSILYGAQPDEAFFTQYRGQHQHLPNGNMLLSESMSGRAFEVGPDGTLVWQFINRYDETDIASMNDVIRYPEDYFTVTDWSCVR